MHISWAKAEGVLGIQYCMHTTQLQHFLLNMHDMYIWVQACNITIMCPSLAVSVLIHNCLFTNGSFSLSSSAKYVSAVSSRGVTHGLSLLGLFIYKYIADTSFVTVSCRTSVQGFVSQCTIVNTSSYVIVHSYMLIIMYLYSQEMLVYIVQ